MELKEFIDIFLLIFDVFIKISVDTIISSSYLLFSFIYTAYSYIIFLPYNIICYIFTTLTIMILLCYLRFIVIPIIVLLIMTPLKLLITNWDILVKFYIYYQKHNLKLYKTKKVMERFYKFYKLNKNIAKEDTSKIYFLSFIYMSLYNSVYFYDYESFHYVRSINFVKKVIIKKKCCSCPYRIKRKNWNKKIKKNIDLLLFYEQKKNIFYTPPHFFHKYFYKNCYHRKFSCGKKKRGKGQR